jgi:uncharacterized HAD superfamily protein
MSEAARLREDPLSKTLAGFADVVFGIIIAQGFYSYSVNIVNFYSVEYLRQNLALLTVYIALVLTWYSYHVSLEHYPYTQTWHSKLRFVVDLIYLVTYEYLMFTINYVDRLAFGISFIFFLYSVDGTLRILEWKDRRVSRAWLSLIFFFAFLAIGIGYLSIDWSVKDYVFPIIMTSTVLLYRGFRYKLGYEVMTLLGVDIDGVLSDQVPVLLRRLRKQGMKSSLTRNDITSWSKRIRGDLTLSQFIQAQELKDRSFIEEMEAIPGSSESLNKLYEKYHVVIASSRPNEARKSTEDWLKSHHFRYHEYFNTGKTGKAGIGLGFLVDDNIEIAREFAKRGKTAILLDQPWNRRRDNEIRVLIAQGKIKVYKNWRDISKFLSSPASSYSSPYS